MTAGVASKTRMAALVEFSLLVVDELSADCAAAKPASSVTVSIIIVA